jgi:hypothetical protein
MDGHLLALMSQFDRHAIPESLLQACFPDLPGREFHQAITKLWNLSLIRENEQIRMSNLQSPVAEKTYELHQLVQLITQLWLANNDNAALTLGEKAVSVLADRFPSPGWASDLWRGR